MRCNRARKHLTGFLDGELDERLRARIEEHLAGCGVCESERRALERVRHAMERMEMPAIEPSVSAIEILDRARSGSRASRERERGDRGRRFLGLPVGLRPAVALAGGLVVIGIVLLVPFLRWIPLPTDEEVFMAEKMELFENLDLIKDLSLVERMEGEEGQAGELS